MAGIVVYLMTANSYRNERFQIWLHPETHKKGFQTMQALYAVVQEEFLGKDWDKAHAEDGIYS